MLHPIEVPAWGGTVFVKELNDSFLRLRSSWPGDLPA